MEVRDDLLLFADRIGEMANDLDELYEAQSDRWRETEAAEKVVNAINSLREAASFITD